MVNVDFRLHSGRQSLVLLDVMARIAAHLLEAAPEDIVFGGNGGNGGNGASVRGARDLGLKAYRFKLDLPEGHGSRLEARHTR